MVFIIGSCICSINSEKCHILSKYALELNFFPQSHLKPFFWVHTLTTWKKGSELYRQHLAKIHIRWKWTDIWCFFCFFACVAAFAGLFLCNPIENSHHYSWLWQPTPLFHHPSTQDLIKFTFITLLLGYFSFPFLQSSKILPSLASFSLNSSVFVFSFSVSAVRFKKYWGPNKYINLTRTEDTVFFKHQMIYELKTSQPPS